MTRCSLIVIGTELTRGIIADRHGQLVSKEMTHIGVHMAEIVAIPDDGSIISVLKAPFFSKSHHGTCRCSTFSLS